MDKAINDKITAIRGILEWNSMQESLRMLGELEQLVSKMDANLTEARVSSEYWQRIHSRKMDKIEDLQKTVDIVKERNKRALEEENLLRSNLAVLQRDYNQLKLKSEHQAKAISDLKEENEYLKAELAEWKEAHNYLTEVYEKGQFERVPEGAMEAAKAVYDFAKAAKEADKPKHEPIIPQSFKKGGPGHKLTHEHTEWAEFIKLRIGELATAVEMQGKDGFWNYGEYSYGVYNGLAIALGIIKGETAQVREEPTKFLAYNYNENNA